MSGNILGKNKDLSALPDRKPSQIDRGSGNLKRIQDGNLCVAGEIRTVEGENLPHAVHSHRRNQPRVMYVLAQDAVSNHKPLPLLVNGQFG